MRSVYPNARPKTNDTIRLGGRTYRLKPWHHIVGGAFLLAVYCAIAVIIMAVYGGVR